MRVIFLLGAVSLLLPGCLQIDGGAVEVAWVIRKSDQTAGSCGDAQPPIDKIRVRIERADVPSATDLCAVGGIGRCEFSCDAGGGTTRFNIESGDYYFSLEPLDATGNVIPSNEVSVPPPTRRTILNGDLTDLGVWQVVVQTD